MPGQLPRAALVRCTSLVRRELTIRPPALSHRSTAVAGARQRFPADLA
ncbi:hypothetical protein [Amycolatopsis thermoflava]